jgi:hypothetical protein
MKEVLKGSIGSSKKSFTESREFNYGVLKLIVTKLRRLKKNKV